MRILAKFNLILILIFAAAVAITDCRPYAVILSETKHLRSFPRPAEIRRTAEIFRFAQDDTIRQSPDFQAAMSANYFPYSFFTTSPPFITNFTCWSRVMS